MVGQDLFPLVKEHIALAGVNTVNQVSTGMLGNLKTLTYEIEMEESDVIETRKRVMHRLALDNLRMMPMCVHGDWMRVFVFKPMRI